MQIKPSQRASRFRQHEFGPLIQHGMSNVSIVLMYCYQLSLPKPLAPQKPTASGSSRLPRIVEACSSKASLRMKAAPAAPQGGRIEPPALSSPVKKTATLQCARHRAVVVSYVATPNQTILGNAAIDGSVYRCIAKIIIMPLRHAVKMPL